MRLTTTVQVSVDGVMQGPGGPEEDERGVFERGGWAHFDDEAGTVMDEIYRRADAFLFGRRTYDIFARSWGTWDDPGDSPIWTALDTRPKYVASSTPFDPTWANTTVLSGSREPHVECRRSVVQPVVRNWPAPPEVARGRRPTMPRCGSRDGAGC